MKKFLRPFIFIITCVLALSLFALAACKRGKGGNNGGGKEEGGDPPGPVAVTSVELSEDTLLLKMGDKVTLTATVLPENASDKTVTWTVEPSDAAVILMDKGAIEAVADGTVTVTATAGGKSDSCKVVVETPPPTYEVTAQQWKSALKGEKVYTVEQYTGSALTVYKIDGDKLYYEDSEGKVILTKDGQDYFRYGFDKPTGPWTKSESTKIIYDMFASVIDAYLTSFAEDYGAFTFDSENGKYICASLDKTEELGGVVENVEIAFVNGAVTNVTFTMGGSSCEVCYIGVTNIELPTEYTDNTAN